jgi:hypothetical protein
VEAPSVAFPRAPDLHGPQSGTATGPARPRRATWTCAATALPVSLLNLSRQDSVPLVPSFVTVAVNVPRARFARPFGLGTSWRALSLVVTLAATAI